jgi:hypothetical protein
LLGRGAWEMGTVEVARLVEERDRLQALYNLADPADPLGVEAAILRLRAAELDLERALLLARGGHDNGAVAR